MVTLQQEEDQNGDKLKRRQAKTATRQYSNSYLELLVIGLWYSILFFKAMT